jgi:uncharacterized protein (TIGR00251 family)
MVVDVKVIPRAGSSGVAGTMADGSLKVRVAAAPEKGKANEELCKILALHFGVSLTDVQIVAGATSTRKRIRIGGLD